jgi:thiamine-phosphate pyrophosphorylase
MSVDHEGLRLRAAKLAAAAAALKRASGVEPPFALAFLTDRGRIPEPEFVLGALPAGTAVVYRDYDDPRRPVLAERYAAICRRRGLMFLVGADQALASAVGAAGAHVPSRALVGQARTRTRIGIVTAACHDADELALAAEGGADLVFLSPVFVTASHPAAPLGAAGFKALAAASAVPTLALGGVDAANALDLVGPNVAGFGAIGAFAP